MRPLTLKRMATFGAAIGFALIAAMMVSSYRNPAMGLLLEAFRFCG